MKKIILIFVLFMLALFGCKNPDKKEYLNDNDVCVYLYKEYVEDNYDLNNFYTLNNINSIDFSHEYTCIIINVEKNRSFLTEDIVSDVYDLLLVDNKVLVIFYEGENYNFFKNTGFANEKDYYENTSQILSYNNFYNEIKEYNYTSNVKSYLACIDFIESQIKAYRGSL